MEIEVSEERYYASTLLEQRVHSRDEASQPVNQLDGHLTASLQKPMAKLIDANNIERMGAF